MIDSAVLPGRLRIAGPIWLLVTSFIVAVFVGSGFLLNLLREQLHYQCSFLRMGASDPGGFSCADGISYIAPGVLILGLLLVLTAFAIAVLASVRRYAHGTRTARVLAGLALLPLGLITWAAWFVTHERPLDAEPDADYWTPAMLAATVLLGCAAVLMIVLCAVPARWVLMRRIAWVGACAVLFAATVVQPGVFVATIVSAGLLGAARLVWRAPADG